MIRRETNRKDEFSDATERQAGQRTSTLPASLMAATSLVWSGICRTPTVEMTTSASLTALTRLPWSSRSPLRSVTPAAWKLLSSWALAGSDGAVSRTSARVGVAQPRARRDDVPAQAPRAADHQDPALLVSGHVCRCFGLIAGPRCEVV